MINRWNRLETDLRLIFSWFCACDLNVLKMLLWTLLPLLIILLIVFTLFIAWVCYLSRRFKYWKHRNIPHYDPKIPQGNMYGWVHSKHLVQIFDATYTRYKGSGPFAGFFFNTQKAAVILDPKLAAKILNTDFQYFQDRGFFHNTKNDPLTGSLYLLDGEEWKLLKIKMCALYGKEKIKHIYSSIEEIAIDLQIVLNEILSESDNGVIDVKALLTRYTTEVIGNCAFGIKDDILRQPKALFYLMARKFFATRKNPEVLDSLINSFPTYAKKFGMKIIADEITSYFTNLVKTTVRDRESSGFKKRDFLDLLMKLKNRPSKAEKDKLTLDELVAQCFSFFITAYDTCTATMCYALVELAFDELLQDDLRKEIVETLNRCNQKLSYGKVRNMELLDQVVLETLRKYPAVPVILRKCTKRYETSDPKYYIEEGTTVIIPTYSYHHDHSYFDCPEIFDPNRFSHSNKTSILNGSYLPFGDGRRSCMGKELGLMAIKIGLIKLLQNHKFELCPLTKLPVKVSYRSFNLNPLQLILKVTPV